MTEGERDDDIGAEVASLTQNIPVVWDEWVDFVLRVLGPRVRMVVDTRVKSRAVR